MKVFVLSLALVGCVNIPPFEARDAGGDGGDGGDDGGGGTPPVGVVADGDAQIVSGPSYTMRFGADGYHFPTSFQVSGLELMASGSHCFDERGTGIGYYPAGIVNGDQPPPNAPVLSSQITVALAGPQVAKIALDWGSSFGCASPYGRSIFTFFPSGRIHRHDVVRETSPKMPGVCNGACATASAWTITSFITVRGDLPIHTGFTQPATEGAGSAPPMGVVCLGDATHQLGVGWPTGFGSQRVRAPDVSAGSTPINLALGPRLPGTIRSELSSGGRHRDVGRHRCIVLPAGE